MIACDDEPDDAGRRARDGWIDLQMRAASRPLVRLMLDTIITGIGAGLATSLCGVLQVANAAGPGIRNNQEMMS